MNEVVLGIDIGGTNTTIGFADRQGMIYRKTLLDTTDYPEARLFVKAVASVAKTILADGTNLRLVGVGIGAPNGNIYSGTIEFAPNLKWKGTVPLAEMFRELFDVPVLLTNDANAAAMGEMIYGAAKGMRNFIFITLGTGLGSGIVADGIMIYGHDGFAGEIGHVILVPGGRVCGCGRMGCVETYCSATGMKFTYFEMLKNAGKSPPPEAESVNSKYIYELALKGDSIALQVFEYTGAMLGLALANSVAYTSPEAIFLFGGVTRAGSLLFEPVKKNFEENLLQVYKNKIKILPSGLPESDAAVLGSASLIWNQNKEK